MHRSLAILLVIASLAAPARAADLGDRTSVLWQVQEWSLDNASWSGNPFDLEAQVLFTHENGVDSHRGFLYTTARTGLFLKEQCLDLRTGKELGKAQSIQGFKRAGFTGDWKPSILVGDQVLGVQDNGWGDYGVAGPERVVHGTSMAFAVYKLDGSLVSQDNLLRSELPTSAPWTPEVAKELLEQGHLYDMNGGIPTNFGFAPGYAHGNRVVISPSGPFTTDGSSGEEPEHRCHLSRNEDLSQLPAAFL